MKHATIKNYGQAFAYLGGKKERPYAHNTRIEIDSLNLGHEVITVRYHGNPVVNMFSNGVNTYSSCGWKTSTTKERINWFLPDGFSLYQERSVWYLTDRSARRGTYPPVWVFSDGITIDSEGNVTGAGQDDGEVKRTIKAIKKFVDGYIAALLAGEVDKPSGGDCWCCAMVVTEGKGKGLSLGEATGDTSHILSHFEESYYVPSMLTNAERFNHRFCMLSKDGIARLWEGMEVSDWQRKIIARDVRSSLTSYLKHVLNLAQ